MTDRSVRDLDQNGPVEEVESEKCEREDEPGPPLQVAGPPAPQPGGGQRGGRGRLAGLQRTPWGVERVRPALQVNPLSQHLLLQLRHLMSSSSSSTLNQISFPEILFKYFPTARYKLLHC